VLCFTRGEASTLHGVPGDLAAVRAAELQAAARALGIGAVTLLGYPDGGLDQVPVGELAGHVVAAAGRADAVGLVVFDPSGVTGHRDHRQATRAALDAAPGLGLPVLGWTLPAEVAAALNAEYDTAFAGHPASGIDLSVAVERTRQLAAVRLPPEPGRAGQMCCGGGWNCSATPNTPAGCTIRPRTVTAVCRASGNRCRPCPKVPASPRPTPLGAPPPRGRSWKTQNTCRRRW
jgi:hypothetical protein